MEDSIIEGHHYLKNICSKPWKKDGIHKAVENTPAVDFDWE